MSVGGNYYVDAALRNKSVDYLNECYLTEQNSNDGSEYLSEHDKLENIALTVVNHYLLITNPDLNESDQQNIRAGIKESFMKLIKIQNIFACGISADNKLNSSEILVRLAFFRLVETGKKYYFEEISNPDSNKLADLNYA